MITINEDWAIDSDELNITLMKKVQKRKKNDEGKYEYIDEYDWTVKGFYPSFEVALKDFTRKELMKDGLGELETVMNKLNEIHDTIKKLNL